MEKAFGINLGFPQSTLIASENLIKEDPEFIAKFITELENSIEFIYGKSLNKEKYITESKVTIDMSILDEVIKTNINFVSAEDSKEAYKLYFEK